MAEYGHASPQLTSTGCCLLVVVVVLFACCCCSLFEALELSQQIQAAKSCRFSRIVSLLDVGVSIGSSGRLWLPQESQTVGRGLRQLQWCCDVLFGKSRSLKRADPARISCCSLTFGGQELLQEGRLWAQMLVRPVFFQMPRVLTCCHGLGLLMYLSHQWVLLGDAVVDWVVVMDSCW